MKRSLKFDGVETIILVIMITALVCLLATSSILIHEITGAARVVNYAGILRGSSQKEVKQELNGIDSNKQINYLDDILNGLQHSSSKYKLIKLDSASFQSELIEQKKAWQELKQAIYTYRRQPTKSHEKSLMDLSDNYYNLCDKSVSIAECYAEGIVTGLKKLEVAIAIIVGCLIVISLERSRAMIHYYRDTLKLNKEAYDDPLTGVKNKRYFEEYFPTLSHDCNYSLVFIDIDHLKQVNDSQGHEAGDRYIIEIVHEIQSQFRTTDVMFRMGGDEFVLFLKECRESIATRMLEQARLAVIERISGSFSYGIVYVSKHDDREIKEILKESDDKMYSYKRAHK